MSCKKIQELDTWNLQSTTQISDGYDWKKIPEPTKENMMVFMEKINELVKEVNYLRCRLTDGVADTHESCSKPRR